MIYDTVDHDLSDVWKRSSGAVVPHTRLAFFFGGSAVCRSTQASLVARWMQKLLALVSLLFFWHGSRGGRRSAAGGRGEGRRVFVFL